MCDYSLQHIHSRPAKLGEPLVTRAFGTGTNGFASTTDPNTAVCILPGSEIAFDVGVEHFPARPRAHPETLRSTTAIFRQINQDRKDVHHDALEFPDGTVLLLTNIKQGQHARVIQLPAAPKNKQEAKAQKRVKVTA